IFESGRLKKLARVETSWRGENRALEHGARNEAGLVEARGACELDLREIGNPGASNRAEIRPPLKSRSLEFNAMAERAVLLFQKFRPLEIGEAIEDRIVENCLVFEFGRFERGIGKKVGTCKICGQMEFRARE